MVITPDDLKEYVGPPPFASDRIYDVTPPGVVMGLAWTSMGGNSLYVEAAGVEKGEAKGTLKTTGELTWDINQPITYGSGSSQLPDVLENLVYCCWRYTFQLDLKP